MGAEQENKSRPFSFLLLYFPSSSLPSSFLGRFLSSAGSSRSSTPRHAKRLTYARERACTLGKRERKKKKKRKGRGRGRERKKWSRHELLLVEKLEVFARCVSKQFCLLIGGVKGRKATPTLLPPPFVIIDERFYSRGPLCRVPELKTSMPAT